MTFNNYDYTSPGIKLRLPSPRSRSGITSRDCWGNSQGTTSIKHFVNSWVKIIMNVTKLEKIIFIKCWSPGSGRSSCFTNFEKLLNGAQPVQLLTKGFCNHWKIIEPANKTRYSGQDRSKIVPTSARMSSWRSICETGTPKICKN